MAEHVGFIREVVGEVILKGADGISRAVVKGDPVREGDLLTTAGNSTVVVSFASGEQLHLEPYAAVQIDDSVSFSSGAYPNEDTDQILALQQALLAGRDVEALEPTAGGGQASLGGDGLNQQASYEREGREGQVDSWLLDFADTAAVAPSSTPNNSINVGQETPAVPSSFGNATIALDVIAGDDIINAQELGSDLTISGTVSGDAAAGDGVTVTIGGVDYLTAVNADNTTFSVVIPAAAVALLTDGTASATVTGTNDAGIPFSASDTRDYTVDGSASAGVALDVIAGDDIINAQELGADLTISGTVGGDAAAGDSVTVTIGGVDYTATVNADNTTFSVVIPAGAVGNLVNGSAIVTVTGTDEAGNPFTSTNTRDYTVDTTATAGVSLDVIAGDDIINAQESGSDLTISGAVSGDAAAGDSVTVTIGGVDYSATVNADNTTFSVVVPAAAVALLTDGTASATVTGTDAAGNPFSASDTRDYTVDGSASAGVSLDVIAGDDIINAQESGSDLTISGTVSGDAAAGDSVTVSIGGVDY
uniref:retention module-containing protein n=1 Tax=Litorivivens sp. TaxID=2020868 RepID=UPI00356241CB